jgi:hypothetical protein
LTARPNFAGVWRMLRGESRFVGQTPVSMLVRIDHNEPVILQTVISVAADGVERRSTFRITTDGRAFENALGGLTLVGRAGWSEDECEIVTTLNAGERVTTYRDYWRLSPDGRRLRMEHRDDPLAGQLVALEPSPEDAAAFA